jgi:hypothetical protein
MPRCGVVEVMDTMIGAPTQSPAGARPGEGRASEAWVLEVLEPDQLVQAKEERLGRARLGRGTQLLMWALRGYVLFMLVVVGYQVWTTIHASGA